MLVEKSLQTSLIGMHRTTDRYPVNPDKVHLSALLYIHHHGFFTGINIGLLHGDDIFCVGEDAVSMYFLCRSYNIITAT